MVAVADITMLKGFSKNSYVVYCAGLFGIYLVVKVMLITSQNYDAGQTRQLDDARLLQSTVADQRRARISVLPAVFPSKLINDSSCSTSRYLGLPARVATLCRNTTTAADCGLLTCRNLLVGSSDAYAVAANVTGLNVSRSLLVADLDVAHEAENCSEFRRKYGFRETTQPEAEDFPIAYNVLTHTNAHQVVRLLRAIYRPNNAYCIHVDRKSPVNFRSAISALAQCFDNVHLASRLEKIAWAGYSRLQADVNCMEDLVESGRDWKYLFNTAGLAFPLKTVEETVKILRLYNGANDIEGIFGRRVHRSRFEKEFIERVDKGSVQKTGRTNPPPPHNIDIVRGSAYGVFSRAFVEFIVRDKRARDLLDWSRRTWSPDEFYWSTLHHTFANPHLHTPGSYSGYPSSKPWLAVYVNWGESRCYGRFVRGVCVFGVGDLPALTLRKEFFANKFYSDYQPLTLDCLEAWLKHKEACPPSDDLEYYRQLPFILPSTGSS